VYYEFSGIVTDFATMKKIFHIFALVIVSACVVAQSHITLEPTEENSTKGGCPRNTLVSNFPTSGGQALVSSTDHGTVNYLKFDKDMIPPNSEVQGFALWAIFAFHDGARWSQCSNDNLTVRVGFFENDKGVPGDTIHLEDIVATVETTTSIVFGTWIVKEVVFSLRTPIIFNEGFISIASTNSPNCWLMVIDSHNGIPNSYVYDNQGRFVQRMVTPQSGSPHPYSFGFCLVGVAPTNTIEIDQLSGVSVFPNPTTGVINVESDFEIDNVKVFDTAGRVVLNATGEGKKVVLKTSALNKGFYILQVSSGKRVQSFKIQVQ